MNETIEVVKKKRKPVKRETDLIECLVLRGIAAGKPGEIVEIPRSAARTLQDAGAVRVVI